MLACSGFSSGFIPTQPPQVTWSIMHIYTTIFILCSFTALVAAVANPKIEKRCIDWFEDCDPNFNTCCNDAACVPVWAGGKGVSAEYYYAFHGFLFISHSSEVLFLRVRYGMETPFLCLEGGAQWRRICRWMSCGWKIEGQDLSVRCETQTA
jgi:hypothetical protein